MAVNMSNQQKNKSLSYQSLMALTALGVVYGDIGTSPLYALKEAFLHSHTQAGTDSIFGILSLVFWALIIVITFKYLIFILRADHNGEGGILALTSLVNSTDIKFFGLLSAKRFLMLCGVFGAAFLYGDGVITPAISILSAVEGLSIITPVFTPYIIPITILILIGLFSFQKNGTATLGKIFGPITLAWFLVIGGIGLIHIIDHPEILRAINPWRAVHFLSLNFHTGFIVLGSVFLVVTGGEALYSDLGHFGAKPIKLAWFIVVLPCLLLNYFGQGAFLLHHPEAIVNPFYLMAPEWILIPLVILATLATTIASQALITGVFSITLQAIQQGYIPRMLVSHTSALEMGQIYIKSINRILMISCILLVLLFKSSSNLAAAYGIAVTATMIITTLLFYFIAIQKWKWNFYLTTALCSVFAVIDLVFLGSNLLKIFDGGWFPLIVGIAGFIYMTTWKRGRIILGQCLKAKIIPIEEFFVRAKAQKFHVIDGTAIYMNRNQLLTPYALIHLSEHFKCMHKNIVFMTVLTEQKPYLKNESRCTVEKIFENGYQVNVRYGYLEQPDIPKAIHHLKEQNPEFENVFDIHQVSFILGRESIIPTNKPGMALWREKLFVIQAKNEMPATQYFQLPSERVVEVGTQVAI
jgi:KUP system potassium uptake protein